MRTKNEDGAEIGDPSAGFGTGAESTDGATGSSSRAESTDGATGSSSRAESKADATEKSVAADGVDAGDYGGPRVTAASESAVNSEARGDDAAVDDRRADETKTGDDGHGESIEEALNNGHGEPIEQAFSTGEDGSEPKTGSDGEAGSAGEEGPDGGNGSQGEDGSDRGDGSAGEDGSRGEDGSESHETLAARLTAAEDRCLRLQAEFQNYRRRSERERLTIWSRAQADLVGNLLDALDDLARVSALELEQASVESIMEGIDLVSEKFARSLSKAGVETLDPKGELFDPNIMEAVTRVPAESDEDDDRVAMVLQLGYRLGEAHLIRPSRVGVFKK